MNKRKSIILITVLIFIAIITSLAIGIAVQKSKPKIIVADITKDDEIQAATNIGESVTAEFTSSTGAVRISGTGTMDKTKWNTFVTSCDKTKIKKITIANSGIYLPADSNSLFFDFTNLTAINNAGNLNTSKVTDMFNMFASSRSLKTLDVSNWNTSNVSSMSGMFSSCKSLTTLDVSKWDTSNVTSMDRMFSGCSSLTTLDVSKWNTSNVTKITIMFSGCSSLTTLDVSNFNLSNTTDDIQQMFSDCSSLTSLDVGNWNTSNVKNMYATFRNCSSLTTLDLSNWDMSKVTLATEFLIECYSLESIKTPKAYSSRTISLPAKNASTVAKWYNATNTSDNTVYSSFRAGTFTGSVELKREEGGVEYNFNSETGEVTIFGEGTINKDLWDTFVNSFGKANIKTITIANSGIYLPADSNSLFIDLTKLTAINNAGNLNTSNVTRMDWMFSNCSILSSLDVSNWNTSNVTAMDGMFWGCSALTSIDVSNWNTSNVTWVVYNGYADCGMFYNCSSLTSLD